jgi:Zn-dependent metalloprotease
LSAELRKTLFDTAQISNEIRDLRSQAAKLTSVAMVHSGAIVELAPAPMVTVYDCKHTYTLPGTLIPNPKKSPDPTAKRTFKETTSVAKFYKDVFKRNSIDNHGMTMMSSIHYGVKYNNAMWDGTQMVYGDGDGSIFIDFTKGDDVIGHELTHGVTQYSLQLKYSDEAGGLNESMSDCFGSMFRQWDKKQDVKKADWLIGHDIMGPTSKARASPVCAIWPIRRRSIVLHRSRRSILRLRQAWIRITAVAHPIWHFVPPARPSAARAGKRSGRCGISR